MSKERYLCYVEANRTAASQKNLSWELPTSLNGAIEKRVAWNLTALAGEAPPPTIWFSNFMPAKSFLTAINEDRIARGLDKLPENYASKAWQDLMKAAVIEGIVIKKNHAGSVLGAILKPIATLAASSFPNEPWEVRREDVDVARRVAQMVSPKLAINTDAIAIRIFDSQGLSRHCPILAQ